MIYCVISLQVNEIEKQLNAIRDNIKIGEDRAARLDRKMEEQQVIVFLKYKFGRLNHARLLVLDYFKRLNKSRSVNLYIYLCLNLLLKGI